MADPTRVILLNGPPGSGKDTAAGLLTSSIHGAAHKEFKQALRRLTAEHYGVALEPFAAQCADRVAKETPRADLGGKTPRGALIHVAEEVIKPKHGGDYFGKCAADDCEPGVFNVFSDCGFPAEIDTMVERFGAANVCVIRLHRDGCGFAGDSRSYVGKDNVRVWDVYNDSSKEMLCLELLTTLGPWLTAE